MNMDGKVREAGEVGRVVDGEEGWVGSFSVKLRVPMIFRALLIDDEDRLAPRKLLVHRAGSEASWFELGDPMAPVALGEIFLALVLVCM